MVQTHVRRQRYKPTVRYVLDKGWQNPVPGMYQRRYSHNVYGAVLRQADPTLGRWYWMVFVDRDSMIASGYSDANTSVEARKMANEAWYSYERHRGVAEWPPRDPHEMVAYPW